MVKLANVLRVFVASPVDVAEERGKVGEVVSQLNVIWGQIFGIQIELIKWETHTFPSIGLDPQQVINDQINDDYDCLIVIMWHRCGTPTGRAMSGTIEEFERAKNRYIKDSSSVNLMIYFKESPVNPNEIDLVQLSKVQQFRSSLNQDGIFFSNFSGLDEFGKLLTIHLSLFVKTWLDKINDNAGKVRTRTYTESASGLGENVEPNNDLGILDLIELSGEQLANLTDLGKRIGQETEEFGNRITARSVEIEQFSKNTGGTPSYRDAKRLIARAATDMTQYADRMKAELPLFRVSLHDGMGALVRAISLSGDLDVQNADRQELKKTLSAISDLTNTLNKTQGGIEAFRCQIASIPRMTIELNKGKREVVNVLDGLISELRTGSTLAYEAERALQALLG